LLAAAASRQRARIAKHVHDGPVLPTALAPPLEQSYAGAAGGLRAYGPGPRWSCNQMANNLTRRLKN